jgi:CrcB protein
MPSIHFLQLLAIGAGGFLGAISRSIVSNQMYHWLGRDFVYGTLTVNALGSFILGLLTMMMIDKFHLSVEWKAFFIVGFLGAFTTFSTFAFETLMYLQKGQLEKATINIIANVSITIFMVWLGVLIGRHYFLSHS